MTKIDLNKAALFQKLPNSEGNSFIVNRYQSPYFETPWHFHQEYELVYCETGFGMRFIGNNFSSYTAGELALIGKNVPHLFKADDSFYKPGATIKPSSVVIQFVDDFLGKDFFNSPEMAEMKRILSLSMNGLMILGDTRHKIRQIMLDMLCCGNVAKLAGLVRIFELLSESTDLQPVSVDEISGVNAMDSAKMNRVLEYALTNYKGNISTGDAARLVNLSESAFCRYFKSRTQKPFLNFVIEMRLNEGCRLLNETELSVLEICYESGFKNLSNFNRLFRKRFNQNPAAYRNRRKSCEPF